MQGYPQPYAAQPAAVAPDTKWRWHYSRFVGVMYGPIPVGVIVVVVGYVVYYATR